MATSAIGPGFLTQTTVFTQQLAASFGFVILISILLDILRKQMYGVSLPSRKKRTGHCQYGSAGARICVSLFDCHWGLAFNIGNIAGAGLGFQVIFGVDPRIGAGVSAVIAILILSSKRQEKRWTDSHKSLVLS